MICPRWASQITTLPEARPEVQQQQLRHSSPDQCRLMVGSKKRPRPDQYRLVVGGKKRPPTTDYKVLGIINMLRKTGCAWLRSSGMLSLRVLRPHS